MVNVLGKRVSCCMQLRALWRMYNAQLALKVVIILDANNGQ